MTKIPPKKIAVQQDISPEYFKNILTKDVTATESIFELVDNAVDAARGQLLKKRNVRRDKYGLPESYDGFRIELHFESDCIFFADNCSGISESILKRRAFVVGKMSKHPFGIGRFGIGLKRALFGLGEKYSLHTDTGKFASNMEFTIHNLQDVGSQLYATRVASSGMPTTQIRISKLQPGVSHEINAESWKSEISVQLSRRYGIFVEKGFDIAVDGISVPAFGPRIRPTRFVVPKSEIVDATTRVRAYIDTGMHGDYRLQYEQDYDKGVIKRLTDQYGWYFVCNDRIVEVATRDKRLGWSAIWHQEYYGFVGWVHFVAEDAQDLPWDTKKTMIDPNSLVFRAISDQLQAFADIYRTQNKLERASKHKENGGNSSSCERGGHTHPGKQDARSPDARAASQTKNEKNRDSSSTSHNQYWETLLPAMQVDVASPKLSALLYEAERLDVAKCYAVSMLFRAILEMALFEHLKTTRSLASVRAMVFGKKAEKGREFTEEQKRKFRPSFADALDWLGTKDEYFPEDVRRDCVFSRNKLKKHVQELNGIVHEGDLTNSAKLKIMRDDSMPLLEFLLSRTK